MPARVDVARSRASRREWTVSRVHVWPITAEVCRAMRDLDFDSDPADELIAATSVVHNVPLLTRDRKMRKSKVVPVAR